MEYPKRSDQTIDPSLQVTKHWNIKHSTSSPRNPRNNGQAESAVKIVKSLLTRAKCSGQDPYLALLAYRSTPVDSHLRSPAEMLYQHALCTTVPQRIRHKDPHTAAVVSAADHGSYIIKVIGGAEYR